MNLSRFLKTALALGGFACAAHIGLAQGTTPFIGEIIMVPYNFAPAGWAFCDGSLLSIQQNTALFSLLGTTYGGNGQNNFALPDLRGRFPLGAGNGPGLSPAVLGAIGGAEHYTLTVAQLPAHSHPITASSAEATVSSPSGAVAAGKARVPLYAASADGTTMAPTGVTGGNQPYPVMPPYTVVNYIIALQGVFPSRN